MRTQENRTQTTDRRQRSLAQAPSASDAIRLIRQRRKQQTRRKKRIAAVVACLAMILLITCVYASANKGQTPPLTVQVEAGDSLWSIAKEYCPDQDIRTAIWEIKELNNMKSDTILEGDLLLIPVV